MWKESKEQLTFEHMLSFTKGLASSQGSYGRIYQELSEFSEDEIDKVNERLIEMNLKNDLMTLIGIFEG